MIVATLILILSAAMFFFYFQAACQRILRRQFDLEYFRSIANANRLEFPSLRKALEESGAPIEYSRLRGALRCDFLALTYLLRNVANSKGRYSNEERLLILYFYTQSLSLAVRRMLKLSDNKVTLRMTSVLQYFANVVGQRVGTVKLGSLTADCPINV
ncbi:MAG: hypothetical protein ABSF46_20795 [Terriglobia bacterium]|jgi:hypothetical protein